MFKGILLVFLGACSFGVLSTFAKLAYHEGYSVADVAGVQAILGFVILWTFYLIQTRIKKTETKTKDIIVKTKTPAYKVIAAGFSSGMVSIFYYQCIKLIPASIAIILLMQFVWIGVLLDFIFFKKHPTRIQIASIVIVLLGTSLASGLFSDEIKTLNVHGILFGLLSAFAYSLVILLNGRVGNDLHPLKKSALMLTGAAFLVLIIFTPSFLFNGLLFSGLLKWGIPLAIFGTVIPPLFFAIGVPKAGITISSILSSAELPVAVLMSYFILQEPVDLIRWIGVIVILFAIILPNLLKLIYTNYKF